MKRAAPTSSQDKNQKDFSMLDLKLTKAVLMGTFVQEQEEGDLL